MKEEIQNIIKIKPIMKKIWKKYLTECLEIRYVVIEIKNLVYALNNLVYF